MTEVLDKFSAGMLDLGVNIYTPDFTPTLQLNMNTVNLTSGINQGVGPRYGMAPLPGHSNNEALATNAVPGLMRSEQNVEARGLTQRTRIFAIFPMRLYSADCTTKGNYFAYLVGRTVSSQMYIDLVIGATYDGSKYSQASDIAAGLPPDQWTLFGVVPSNPMYEFVSQSLSTMSLSLQDLLKIDSQAYVSSAVLSVAGQDEPMQYIFGNVVTAPTATRAPDVNFWRCSAFTYVGTVQGGLPPEFNLQTYKKGKRKLFWQCVDSTQADCGINYVADIYPSASNFNQGLRLDESSKSIDANGLTVTKNGPSTAYSTVRAAVVQDPDCVCNNGYQAVAVACQGAKIALIQDWMQGKQGALTQWVDPTVCRADPPQIYTGGYSLAQVPALTAFMKFPGFTRGTEMASAYGIALNGANSGLLRAGNVYEFTYAMHNKRTGHETNVGVPVKFQVGTASDFRSLTIWNSETYTASNPLGVVLDPADSNTIVPWLFSDGQLQINYYEYRFYYRAEGSFEWLPALYMDAVDYWFNMSSVGKIVACGGAVAGLPGGQPGGFVDNSPLAADKYFDVIAWRNRLWWCSDKQINFSIQDDVFCYPGRNSISAGTGEFRGMKVHNYPGQADQNSRLIIFGSKEIYVGQFTGNTETTPVQVSPDTVGDYPIDASDFEVNPWTTVTAFSARSAVVAEGELYYWGPQGIFHDNGTETPDRLTIPLEPDIFTLYDPSKTREIHCVFNDQTHEIIWFYSPRVADGYLTHTLVYNVRSRQFLPGKFDHQVDSSFKVNIETTNQVAGDRTLISARKDANAASVQRSVFFDQFCRAGDFTPTMELMVKTIATPVSGQRRLTLAAGYDATQFGSIVVGDQVSLTQLTKYATTLTLGTDMICTVTAVGAGTIDVSIPSGGQIDAAATLTAGNYFPVWHGRDGSGISDIPWKWATGYWMPANIGVNYNGFWLYLYMMLKTKLLPSAQAETFHVKYKTPTASALVDSTVSLVDNSDGNQQIYHNLAPDSAGNEGQAIKLELSGNHIGSEWVLQYLEAHVNPNESDVLKQFEG